MERNFDIITFDLSSRFFLVRFKVFFWIFTGLITVLVNDLYMSYTNLFCSYQCSYLLVLLLGYAYPDFLNVE